MGLYDRFQFLDLLRNDGIRTFRAREIATGRLVEAHLIPPESPETLKILLKLDFLSPNEKSRVLERGDHEGTTIIVTEPLPDSSAFREWLTINSRPPGAPGREEPHDPEKRRLDTEGGWRVMPTGPLDPPEAASHTLALPTYQPRQEISPAEVAPVPRPRPSDGDNRNASTPHSESWSAAAAPTVALRLPRPVAISQPVAQPRPQAAHSSIPSSNGPPTRLLRNVLLLLVILVVVASLVAFVVFR